ncbi:MAG: PEP-CTERM sorting domain-containing protein [Planctomycetota bacterium]|nr:PEP-CTERM sorting domain-containing protein [Planctomycetota bacterium]
MNATNSATANAISPSASLFASVLAAALITALPAIVNAQTGVGSNFKNDTMVKTFDWHFGLYNDDKCTITGVSGGRIKPGGGQDDWTNSNTAFSGSLVAKAGQLGIDPGSFISVRIEYTGQTPKYYWWWTDEAHSPVGPLHQVPAPGSLALMGIATGLVSTRRRR